MWADSRCAGGSLAPAALTRGRISCLSRCSCCGLCNSVLPTHTNHSFFFGLDHSALESLAFDGGSDEGWFSSVEDAQGHPRFGSVGHSHGVDDAGWSCAIVFGWPNDFL